MMEASSIDTFFFLFPFFFFAGTGSADFAIIVFAMIFVAFALFFLCVPLRLSSNGRLPLDYEHQAEIQEYCPYCHSKITDDAIYCHKCGKNIADSE